MHSFVKNVFIILGTLALSLILFNITLGDFGRSLAWDFLEPVFNSQLEDHLFQDVDGDIYNKTLNDNFTNLRSLDNDYFNF